LLLLSVLFEQALTNVDDISAAAATAYTALQQQAAGSAQPADAAARRLQQSVSGFVPLSSLQAFLDAVSKVMAYRWCRTVWWMASAEHVIQNNPRPHFALNSKTAMLAEDGCSHGQQHLWLQSSTSRMVTLMLALVCLRACLPTGCRRC
jgi:hypothetical protein